MDSRKITEGSLFFRNKTMENSYVKDVLDKGVSLVIADNTDVKDERIVKSFRYYCYYARFSNKI